MRTMMARQLARYENFGVVDAAKPAPWLSTALREAP
ncbi:hypothetical protein SAMN05414139_10113 [Burkholderia sp. D7]|nr:hypothetical protein SAMN05414139_10113 [Burkholderia sp. D7]